MNTPDVKNIFSYQEKKYSPVGYENVTPSKVDTLPRSVQYGIEFIFDHLDTGLHLFPRNIMTKRLGCQVEVFNMEAMLRYFEWSDYQDCRISAYPTLTRYNGLNFVAPSLIMIDLDLDSNSNSEVSIAALLQATLKRIYRLLKVMPTVLWTGNGYHIYLPIKAFILEEEKVFADFVEPGLGEPDLSTKFLRYAEQFFTEGRHDRQHKPSINNCLLRVPGTYNSKNGEKVRIIQEWDGQRAAIQYMLRDFRCYLIQERLDRINYAAAAAAKKNPSGNIPGQSENCSIDWIERLLETPVADYRKYCIWRILVPYLINIKRFSDDTAASIIMIWLDKCSAKKRVSFYAKARIKTHIQRVKRIGYYPISLNDLQKDNAELYDFLLEGKS